MTERWRDVRGFEGVYQVSDRGGLRSLERLLPSPAGPKKVKTRTLRPRYRHHRAFVVLHGGRNGRGGYAKEILRLERLVWETFRGPVPVGKDIRRRDGDVRNSALANLELFEIESPVGACP